MQRKVYVASALTNYEQILDIKTALRRNGIETTFSWASWYLKYKDEPLFARPLDRKGIALKEMQSVREAEVLLAINKNTRGTHVELGMAVAFGIPVVVYNPEEATDIPFYHLPGVTLARTLEDALDCIVEKRYEH